MRKFYTLAVALFATTFAMAQCDDLFFSEYIEGDGGNNKALEIYNASASAINLSNYTVKLYPNSATEASQELILDGTLNSGDVFVIANSGSDQIILDEADTFSEVTFFSGDDALTLEKNGSVIDVIGVIGERPSGGWPVGNGFTQNQTLVRKTIIQEGSNNWSTASTQYDVLEANDFSNLGSHTMTPCGTPIDTTVNFVITDLTVNEEDSTYTFTLALDFATNTSVDVVLASGDAADVENYTTKNVIFMNAATATFTVAITDDMIEEENETLVFELTNPSGNVILGADSLFTLTINRNDFPIPTYDINVVNGTDVNGNPDSLDVVCTVTGTVLVQDLGFNSSETYIIDATGGIAIYHDTEDDAPYNEGDEVTVTGIVSNRAGVQTIDYTEYSISVNGPGTIPAATVVTALNETTEAQLVKIEGLSLVDNAEWTNVNGGSGFNVRATNGTDTFTIRIDRDIDELYNSDAPAGNFSLTGVGGQFDPSEPFTEGYQILPRKLDDIEVDLSSVETYDISAVTTVDADGLPDSIGVICALRGTVLGINLNDNGLGFTLHDGNRAGIGVFSPAETFGYTVNEGDEIIVIGEITQFNGVTQIGFLQSLEVVGSGTLPTVLSVPSLNESTESDLVKLENVTIPTPSEWLGNGSNFTVFVSNQGGTHAVRIQAATELSNSPAPTGRFSITGIGSQFDPSEPFTSGYQIQPRYATDIEQINAVNDISIEALNVYPNPAADFLIVKSNETGLANITVTNLVGETVYSANAEMNGSLNINLPVLTNGMYNLNLSVNGKTLNRAFIVQQ